MFMWPQHFPWLTITGRFLGGAKGESKQGFRSWLGSCRIISDDIKPSFNGGGRDDGRFN